MKIRNVQTNNVWTLLRVLHVWWKIGLHTSDGTFLGRFRHWIFLVTFQSFVSNRNFCSFPVEFKIVLLTKHGHKSMWYTHFQTHPGIHNWWTQQFVHASIPNCVCEIVNWRFPEIGLSPKSYILMGFSSINYKPSILGVSSFMDTPYVYIYHWYPRNIPLISNTYPIVIPLVHPIVRPPNWPVAIEPPNNPKLCLLLP